MNSISNMVFMFYFNKPFTENSKFRVERLISIEVRKV